MSRLPIIGQDDGVWGQILNDYLLVSHNPDGTEKSTGSGSDSPQAGPIVFLPPQTDNSSATFDLGNGSNIENGNDTISAVLSWWDQENQQIVNWGIEAYDHLGNWLGEWWSNISYDSSTGEAQSTSDLLPGKNATYGEGFFETGTIQADNHLKVGNPAFNNAMVQLFGYYTSNSSVYSAYTSNVIEYLGGDPTNPNQVAFRLDKAGNLYANSYNDLDGTPISGGGGATAGPVYEAPTIFIPGTRSNPDAVDVFGDGSLSLEPAQDSQTIVLTRFLESDPDNGGASTTLDYGVEYYDHNGNWLGEIYPMANYDSSGSPTLPSNTLSYVTASNLEAWAEFGALYVDYAHIRMGRPAFNTPILAMPDVPNDFTADAINYPSTGTADTGFRVDHQGNVYAPSYNDLNGDPISGGGSSLPAGWTGDVEGPTTDVQTHGGYISLNGGRLDIGNGGEILADDGTTNVFISSFDIELASDSNSELYSMRHGFGIRSHSPSGVAAFSAQNAAGATIALDAGGMFISNLSDPSNDQDAATKAYVDTQSGGGSLPAWFQTGSNSPVGSIDPSQQGAVFFDTFNGGEYLAVGPDNSDWISIGGNSDPTIPGLSIAGGAQISIVSAAGHALIIRDVGSALGTGDGIYWNTNNNADGSQELQFVLGSSGQFTHTWAADGTYTMPGTNVKGLADPTDDQDAATKAYVDSTGGSVTLPLNLGPDLFQIGSNGAVTISPSDSSTEWLMVSGRNANHPMFHIDSSATASNNDTLLQIDNSAGRLLLVSSDGQVRIDGQTAQANNDIFLVTHSNSTIFEVGVQSSHPAVGFFGHSVAQQSTPSTLADVIALLQAYGLSA